MKLKNFPKIETKRLQLRHTTLSDVEIVYALRSNKIVRQYIASPLFTNIEEAQNQVIKVMDLLANNEAINWIIYNKKEAIKLGEICLWNFSSDRKTAEVGYSLLPDYFGKGIMTEALQAVIHFGFKTLKLTAIEAFTHRDNDNSKKLLETNKFIFQPERKDEGFPNNIIYTLSV